MRRKLRQLTSGTVRRRTQCSRRMNVRATGLMTAPFMPQAAGGSDSTWVHGAGVPVPGPGGRAHQRPGASQAGPRPGGKAEAWLERAAEPAGLALLSGSERAPPRAAGQVSATWVRTGAIGARPSGGGVLGVLSGPAGCRLPPRLWLPVTHRA